MRSRSRVEDRHADRTFAPARRGQQIHNIGNNMEGEKARHEHHSHAGTDAQTREVAARWVRAVAAVIVTQSD